MATHKKGGGGKNDSRNTRVYSPTHHGAASASETRAGKSTTHRGTQKAAGKEKVGQSAQRTPARESAVPATRRARATSSKDKLSTAAHATRIHAQEETRQAQAIDFSQRRERVQAKKQGEARRDAQTGKRQSTPANQARPVRHTNAKRKPAGYSGIHRLERTQTKEERERRTQPKKKREPMDKRTLLAILIAVVCGIGMLLAGYFVFLVDTIIVEGNTTYSESSIISLSGLTTGRHMLLVNIEKAEENLSGNPYLKVLRIERELPRTIRLEVEERRRVAAISVQDYTVIIDMEGHVLSIGGQTDLSGLLRISGISQLGFQVNQSLGPTSDIQIKALLLILEMLEKHKMRQEIVSIDLTNPLRLSMQTAEGITVLLGQSDNLEEKMQWVHDTLPSLQEGGITDGVLDVSAKGGAIYSPAGSSDRLRENYHAQDAQTTESDLPLEPQDPIDLEEPEDSDGDALPDGA